MAVPAHPVSIQPGGSGSRRRGFRGPFRRPQGLWAPTGSMLLGRRGHTATALPDGAVLVAGGSVGGLGVEDYTASCEVYERARRSWSGVADMAVDRTDHVAVLLGDRTVLVVGGLSDGGAAVADAEVYSPAERGWKPAGSMRVPRVGHTATLLSDGRVLVTGGYDKSTDSFLHTAELYDPPTGAWTATGSMSEPRNLASATPLPDGRVLVAGGYNTAAPGGLSSCEVYDPAGESWSATGSLALPRDNDETGGHRTARLADGSVLVLGGYDWTLGQYTAGCERYDPATGTWSPAAPMRTARGAGVAVTLADGTVLVVGGYNDAEGSLASAERYLPARDEWRAMRPMTEPRGGFATLTALDRHRVLVAGGDGPPPTFLPLASAETARA